ncbi:MAG: hypothetical protein ACYSWQ_13015 [Planctomycetota bacterium]|jgi:hypothetical protein
MFGSRDFGLLGAPEPVGLARIEQSDGVVERVARRVDVAARERGVIARRGKGPANHLLGRVIAFVLLCQHPEKGVLLLLRRE